MRKNAGLVHMVQRRSYTRRACVSGINQNYLMSLGAMMKLISTVGLLALFVPITAHAGAISSQNGVSATSVIGNNWGNTTGSVTGEIFQNNELDVQSYSSNYQIDISGENARIGIREEGDSTSIETTGAIADNSLAPYNDYDVTDSEYKPESLALEKSIDQRTGNQSDSLQLNTAEGQINNANRNIETTTNQLSGAGSINTWEGIQSEAYIDGTLSVSVGSGYTSTEGIIRESGLTKTDITVDTFNNDKSFGNTASSFTTMSF
jgi:hypothetical protein